MAGTLGKGTTLGYGAGPTAVGNIKSVKIGGVECETIDISNNDSTGNWREFIAGMKNAGEITFELTYDGAGTGLSTLYGKIGATAENWTVTYPGSGASTDVCSGFVTKIDVDDTYDDQITASVTIKRSGAPTFTA